MAVASFMERVVADSLVTAAAGPLRSAAGSTLDLAPLSEAIATEFEETDEAQSEAPGEVNRPVPPPAVLDTRDDVSIDGRSDAFIAGLPPPPGEDLAAVPEATAAAQGPPPTPPTALPSHEGGTATCPAAIFAAHRAVDEGLPPTGDSVGATASAPEGATSIIPVPAATVAGSAGEVLSPSGESAVSEDGLAKQARHVPENANGHAVRTDGPIAAAADAPPEHRTARASTQPPPGEPVQATQPEAGIKTNPEPADIVSTPVPRPTEPTSLERSIDALVPTAGPETKSRDLPAAQRPHAEEGRGVEPASDVYIGRVDIYIDAPPQPVQTRRSEARRQRPALNASAAYLRRL